VNIPVFPTVTSLIAQIDQASLESYSTEKQWVEARKNGIGASESAILFAQGYAGSSPYKMYCEKLGLIPRDDMEQKYLRIGKLMEPVLRRLCTEETGLPCYEVGENHTFRSKKYPFLTASLDGLIIDEGGLGVLELKNIHYFNREEWSDGSGPLKYQIQLQHQLAVTGLPFGYLFGLVGGQEPFAHKIQRNDSFIEKALIPACKGFFECMQSQTPPSIDGSEATARALKLLHPDDDGSEVVLDERFSDFDVRLEEIKAEQKTLDTERRVIENEIKSAMGSSTFGLLPSGIRYSLKTIQTDGYWVIPQKYRKLLRKKGK
jgi:putative phage-type endonuclease